MPLDFKQAASTLIDAGYSDDEIRTTLGAMKQHASTLMDQGLPDAEIEKRIAQTGILDKSGKRINLFQQAAAPKSEAPMTLKQFTEARQQSATQEPAFQKLAGATIPTLATLAGFAVPGAGIGALAAQSALSAGGTAANQAAGFEPYSARDIAISAALPAAAQGVVKGVKGAYKALGKFAAPGATREAGVQAGLQRLGAVPDPVERAYTAPASKAAYAVAEAQPPLPVDEIVSTLDDVAAQSGRAIPNKPALRQIQATKQNILPPIKEPEVEGATNMAAYIENKRKAADELVRRLAAQPTEVGYREVMNEVKGLRAQADMAFRKGNTVSGTTLSKAANSLLDKMDEISPAIKEANAMYRREQSVEKIAKVLSNPRPDVKLGELFLKDDLVRGVIPKKDAQFIQNVARQISTMGTQASPYSGSGARFLNLIATPLAAVISSDAGRFLMRQTFKEGKVTAAGLATVAQFGRAFLAQEQGQE